MISAIQTERECWLCGRTDDLHVHHVFFGTANRKKSDKYLYVVYLCAKHHNMSDEGVHFDKDFDLTLKRFAQRHFEAHHGTRDDFRREFGKSWL